MKVSTIFNTQKCSYGKFNITLSFDEALDLQVLLTNIINHNIYSHVTEKTLMELMEKLKDPEVKFKKGN